MLNQKNTDNEIVSQNSENFGVPENRKSVIHLEIIAEIVFTVLPLIVIFLVLVVIGNTSHFWASSEWSFASVILFGQAIVKFAIGLSKKGVKSHALSFLILTMLIVFGLVPSIVVLIFILNSIEHGQHVIYLLQVAQIFIFILSCLCFLFFGSLGKALEEK